MAKFSLRIQQTDQEGKYFFCLMLNNLIKKFFMDPAFWVACGVISNMRWSGAGPTQTSFPFLNSAQFYIVKKKVCQKKVVVFPQWTHLCEECEKKKSNPECGSKQCYVVAGGWFDEVTGRNREVKKSSALQNTTWRLAVSCKNGSATAVILNPRFPIM